MTGTDIYHAQEKNLELFVQVGYDALDTGDGGISGETNPIRHREIAKKLAPAFSARNFKAKEGAVHKHIDLFIEKMKVVGATGQGAELRRWSDWLALDLSADMTYSLEMGQMRDSKELIYMEPRDHPDDGLLVSNTGVVKGSLLLSSTLKMSLFLATSQITRKVRLLAPMMFLTIPPSVLLAMPTLIKMNAQDAKRRIERRGRTEHLDYFEQLIPADGPVPADKKQLYHVENVAGQLLIASWQPLANQFYSLIFFLLKEPAVHAALVEEIKSRVRDLRRNQHGVYGDLEVPAGLRTRESSAPSRYG